MKSLHPFQRIALLSAVAIAANSPWLFASELNPGGNWYPQPPPDAEIIYIYVTYPQQLPCN